MSPVGKPDRAAPVPAPTPVWKLEDAKARFSEVGQTRGARCASTRQRAGERSRGDPLRQAYARLAPAARGSLASLSAKDPFTRLDDFDTARLRSVRPNAVRSYSNRDDSLRKGVAGRHQCHIGTAQRTSVFPRPCACGRSVCRPPPATSAGSASPKSASDRTGHGPGLPSGTGGLDAGRRAALVSAPGCWRWDELVLVRCAIW